MDTNIKQLDTQQIAVLLAAITYSNNPQQDMDTLLPGWEIVWNGNQTYDGNYAFIATDASESQYALAIRGSLPPNDIFSDWYAFANWILEDLDVITRVNWPYSTSNNALISNGAFTAFTNVQNMQDSSNSGLSIYDYLKNNAVASGKQVIITGHSLGGNIANVYASYFVAALVQDGFTFDNTSLFTFAAPAAGNSDFATDLDNKISDAWHYENSNDIVPKFPVSTAILALALLYFPSPSAGKISFTYEGHVISLREAFMLLAGVFYPYHYQQQATNYKVFFNALDTKYESNTLEDWFYQAGSQHAMSNYANYLGVSLTNELDKRSRLI